MKKYYLIILSLLLFSLNTKAQTFQNAGEYITYISQQCQPIMEDYMSYSSAVAHGKKAKQIDSKRQELLTSVKNAQQKVARMAPFKGDKSLRDSTQKFLKIYNIVLNEDYGKIVNMEDVAEQSYDAMEAYLLAQDMAGEKLSKAVDDLSVTEKEFAKKNNIQLIEGEGNSKLNEKLEKTGEVNAYHRVVYLIFFKSFKQEVYMLDALQKKDINGVEQNKNSLIKFSDEGLKKLATIQPYNGDKSLTEACKQLLTFLNMESKEKVASLTKFYISEDNYLKEKKAFEAKKQRTQADVDQYNKAVNDYNTSANDFNKLNKELFDKRSVLINNWNKASENFFDKHVPKYNK